jgi:hypothetical protein
MAIILDGNIGLTYPDVTTQNTSAIIGGKLPTARLPAGSVLQVVNFSTTAVTSTNSGTPTATALTASITPTSASSKIFVSFSGMFQKSAGSGIFSSLGLVIYRNDGSLIYTTRYGGYSGATATLYMPASGQYLDSPTTTSATSYSVYIFNETGGGSNFVAMNNDSSGSTITLMEIAA